VIEERIFNNRYRLDRKLGEGGMATVFCGTDTLLRRRVAVKVLREQYAADEEFVRRFYQEAESAAKLSHPNIVNTYDVGREGDVYYIVMELVDGPSLAEIIAGDGKLPEPVAIDYAAQICSGLAYAHRQGLLHRDIKPANILVTKDDVCKLSDFGIARAVSTQTMALTKPGLVMGSVYYISPEQAQGHDLHESSDLYSVGVVLYQMLTGDLPFTGESPVTVALKHIGDPVPTIDTGALGTSPALASIVNRLLQKNPQNRFQSAAEVASALREARERPSVAHFGISNDAPTVPFRSVQPPPRRSPMPDRPFTSIGDDEERKARSTTAVVVTLIAALVAAIAIGYALFGKNISFHPGGAITVSNYRGMSDVDARKALENAGLVVDETKTASDTVAANHVIEQNPVPGTSVDANTTVHLIVSNGLPLIGLQDVTKFTLADATNVLLYSKFKVKVVRRHDSATKDTVVAQLPKAGASVRQGSEILLTVSDGPAPVILPNLVGKTADQAQAIAAKDHFVLDASATAPSNQYPAGQIIAQDVAAGTSIDPTANLTVHATVSTGGAAVVAPPGNAAVPDVQGHAYADALSTLKGASLTWTVVYNIQKSGNGTIVGEEPAPGTPATGAVTLTLSVPGEVPDVQNMTIDQARTLLESDGYPIKDFQYTTIEGADGNVVRTIPQAGTGLTPGTAVTLVVNGTQP
jgi:serine/threonine-protein kinase